MQDEITSSQELSSSQANLLDIYLRGCIQEDGTFNIDPPRLSDIDIFNSEEDEQYQDMTVTQFHYENDCTNLQNPSSLPYSNPTWSTVVPNIIQPPEMMPSVVSSLSSACMPAKTSWTGDYGFDVHFAATNKPVKGTTWIYSTERNKLYVSKGVPCPVGIIAKGDVPSDCLVKVEAMFTHPSRPQETVRRCTNHALEDIKKGITYSYHLIRCECDSACYCETAENGQLSVCFPYQKPPIGESYSTYILKFMCFGSCSGGPNRRPLFVVFTLEKEGIVLGRRSLDLKVCACPARDFRKDDMQRQADKENEARSLPKKRKVDTDPYVEHVAELFQFVDKMQVSGKKEEAPNEDGVYTITVTDRSTYRFLRHAKYMYEFFRFMTHFSPAVMNCLKNAKKKPKRDDSTDTSD